MRDAQAFNEFAHGHGAYKTASESPERSTIWYSNGNAVEFKGRKYHGYYIGYNDKDSDTYESDTTAVVLGVMEEFFILNGNHAKVLAKIAGDSGFDEVVSYLENHQDQMNKLSDRL